MPYNQDLDFNKIPGDSQSHSRLGSIIIAHMFKFHCYWVEGQQPSHGYPSNALGLEMCPFLERQSWGRGWHGP